MDVDEASSAPSLELKKLIVRLCVILVAVEVLAMIVLGIGILVVGPTRSHDPEGLLARLEADMREPGRPLTGSDISEYFGKPSAVYSNVRDRRPGVPKFYVSHYGGVESFRVYRVEGSGDVVAVEFLGYTAGVPRFEVFVYQPDVYEAIRSDIERPVARD
jgi:hypothetical protein